MIYVVTRGVIYIEIIAVFFFLTSVCSLVARTQESTPEDMIDTDFSHEKSDSHTNPQAKTETTSSESKRDPFRPFIKLLNEEERTGDGSLVPPIKRYPLQEFRIAGILWIEGEPRAMIVDPEKNTYYLAIGDEIGNRGGVILEIRNTGILVKETRYYEDLFGENKIEVKNVVLSFQE
ncbi:MAG: pilus assembly protein PilP [Deltaproteobacteria bacterium]|nr:pilus assembly protein PilP [Deltaproteobacteria bacterium]